MHFHSRKCIWKCCLENAAILFRPQCVNTVCIAVGWERWGWVRGRGVGDGEWAFRRIYMEFDKQCDWCTTDAPLNRNIRIQQEQLYGATCTRSRHATAASPAVISRQCSSNLNWHVVQPVTSNFLSMTLTLKNRWSMDYMQESCATAALTFFVYYFNWFFFG